MTITENFERFQYFETNFIKSESLFHKLQYRFLVEITGIENKNKTTLSEANVNTNRMGNIKWAYHKKRSFASNYFSFSKILFQFKNLVNELIWWTNDPHVHICTFLKRWNFIQGCSFPFLLRQGKDATTSTLVEIAEVVLKNSIFPLNKKNFKTKAVYSY